MLAVTEWVWVGPVLVIAIGLALYAFSTWLLWLVALAGFACDCALYAWAKVTGREPGTSRLTRFAQRLDN